MSRHRTRFALVVLIAALAAAVVTRIAFARTHASTIGTGVVVIDTNLGYEGGAAAGTGMVLTSSGEVLTNNHVIRGATTIRIVVPGTGHSYAAKVVGYDVTDDVAVIQATNASNLKTISLGSSSSLKVGQAVKAVGNAGGTGSLTTATGTLTATSQAITVNDDQGGSQRLTGLIETNAGLQPGDSGGPLFNSAGKVIGMDTAASTNGGRSQVSVSDEGYAIPINKAITFAKQIAAGKSSTAVHIGGTAFLGVELTSPAYGYSSSGATIAALVPNGPAEKAGLLPGDLITGVDGKAVTSPGSMTALILLKKPGAKISVTYYDSNGGTDTATVTLGSGPPQ